MLSYSITATVLLRRGCLKLSDVIISGSTYAKVRQLVDSTGTVMEKITAGNAAVVSGWKELPQAGNEVLGGSESDVKKACQNRIRRAQIESTRKDADFINEQRRNERDKKATQLEEDEYSGSTEGNKQQEGQDPRELRLIVKGDVSGTVEALTSAVQAIGNQRACVKVISTGVGDVNDSDIMMAKICGGKWIRKFFVKCNSNTLY